MFTLKVVPQDGEPYAVKTNLFTVVAWERKFKRAASDMGKAMAMEWLAFLAYEASKQSGVPVPMVFDDFLKKLEAVEVVDEETENPTEPGVIPGA